VKNASPPMTDPQALITVWGAYRVLVDEKELRASLHRYYFFGNAVRDVGGGVLSLIETCIPLALFEVTLENLDERFRISDFTQEMPETPRTHWQVPYDEALLSSDGMQLLARNSKCTRGLRGGRIAFYFHYCDPSKPMFWTYGQFCGPPVQTVPRRLWDLIPYSPVD